MEGKVLMQTAARGTAGAGAGVNVRRRRIVRVALGAALRRLRRLLVFSLGCGRRTAGGKRVIVLGFDGLDYGLTKSLHRQRAAAELRASSPPGRIRAARHDDSAAESGGVVDLHHRPRSRRSRHLRLHPPRSADDAAVSVDVEDRRVEPDDSVRRVADSAVGRNASSFCARASRSGRCSRIAASRRRSSACRRTFRRRERRRAN